MKRIATGLFICVVAVAQANAQDCYQSSIVSPSPFMGNNGEIIKLSDGSLWEVKYEYEYLYEYFPTVVICPGQGKLIVGRTSLNVQLVSGAPDAVTSARRGPGQAGKWDLFEETQLEGTISGTVRQGRIFRTTSGNVYEVTGLTLQLVLEVQPEVMVLRNGDTYRLVVEGFDEPLLCRKLNGGPAAKRRGVDPIPSVIETQVDGEFNGWEGETIVKLTNGQVWRQSEYHYFYHYAYRPKVVVYRSGGGYKMQVEGVDQAVGVELLR